MEISNKNYILFARTYYAMKRKESPTKSEISSAKKTKIVMLSDTVVEKTLEFKTPSEFDETPEFLSGEEDNWSPIKKTKTVMEKTVVPPDSPTLSEILAEEEEEEDFN